MQEWFNSLQGEISGWEFLEVGGKCVIPYLANANDDSNEDNEDDEDDDDDVDDDGDDDVDDDDDGDDDDNAVNKEQGHHPPPTRWHLLPSDSVIKCIAFIIDHSPDKMRFGIIIFVCFVTKVHTLSSTNHQCQTSSNDISSRTLGHAATSVKAQTRSMLHWDRLFLMVLFFWVLFLVLWNVYMSTRTRSGGSSPCRQSRPK